MAITIYSNISSLTAQRRLGQSTADLRRSFERLSSGLRINRASDDAAGLAIADDLNLRSRVATQGVRNLNDGISVLQIADSAVGELSNIVIRIQELAEQSANGTLGAKQREAIDKEAQALSKEFTRIIQTTEFNGSSILSADYGELSLQAGFGENGRIASSLGGVVGDGTFAAATTFTVGKQAWSSAIGDLNNDGILDIVSSASNIDQTIVRLGVGDGTFGSATTFNTGNEPQMVRLADFNNDGTLDVVTVDKLGSGVSVMIGNGDGSFQQVVSSAVGSAPWALEVGDIDGDGNMDVVSANFASGDATVLLGKGDGTFSSGITIATGASTFTVAIGDLNGDSVLDVIAANYGPGNTTTVLLGNGDGTFGGARSFLAGSKPATVILADFDSDGILDAATVNYSSGDVTVALGKGDGTFGAVSSFAAGSGPTRLNVADLNGDGLLDIVTASFTDSKNNILLANGDGTFAAATSIAAGNGPVDVQLADLNGDGIIDIVGSNNQSNDITVMLGNSTAGTAPILPFSLSSQAEARQSMAILDRKLSSLGGQRAQIGAFISRVETAINVTSITAENLKAAESQIRDADIAFESAELVRKQILQQAGAAVLTQANQQPQIALQLLGGI